MDRAMELRRRVLFVIFLAISRVTTSNASKCPEPRKPHPTSCTIFYNCINLPGGGYVWAPARCTDGLYYQPYLRICVLPGDSWTCDILATDPPETTTRYYGAVIDENQSSYLGVDEDASDFNEPLDGSMSTDVFPEKGEPQPSVTPYPLIEVAQADPVQNDVESTIQHFGVPMGTKHSEDNYLYHFGNGYKKLMAPPARGSNEELRQHLEHLTKLIDRLTAYQASAIPLDRQPPRQTIRTTTESYTTVMNNDQQSSVVDYLLKNYLLKVREDATTSTSSISNDEVLGTDEPTTESPDIVINGAEAENHIVVVMDSLGNKQYFTMDKYKSIASKLHGQTVELLPCTSGIRLANSTDCTKYYSCDPMTARTVQFTCPTNTAFNDYKRICDVTGYDNCSKNSNTLRISPTASKPNGKQDLNGKKDLDNNENPCQTIGKIEDPSSDNHYYLCYSDMSRANDVRPQKMTCPNSLIFCKSKKVCTTKKLCSEYA